MSTKTSIKRIALVAVSALGFGLLASVAPAQAAATISATNNPIRAGYASAIATGANGTPSGTYGGPVLALATTEALAYATDSSFTLTDSDRNNDTTEDDAMVMPAHLGFIVTSAPASATPAVGTVFYGGNGAGATTTSVSATGTTSMALWNWNAATSAATTFNFNTAGTYTVRMWANTNSSGTPGAIDASEPTSLVTITVGGSVDSISLSSSELTSDLRNLDNAFTIALADSSGRATALTGTETLTISDNGASLDGGAAADVSFADYDTTFDGSGIADIGTGSLTVEAGSATAADNEILLSSSAIKITGTRAATYSVTVSSSTSGVLPVSFSYTVRSGATIEANDAISVTTTSNIVAGTLSAGDQPYSVNPSTTGMTVLVSNVEASKSVRIKVTITEVDTSPNDTVTASVNGVTIGESDGYVSALANSSGVATFTVSSIAGIEATDTIVFAVANIAHATNLDTTGAVDTASVTFSAAAYSLTLSAPTKTTWIATNGDSLTVSGSIATQYGAKLAAANVNLTGSVTGGGSFTALDTTTDINGAFSFTTTMPAAPNTAIVFSLTAAQAGANVTVTGQSSFLTVNLTSTGEVSALTAAAVESDGGAGSFTTTVIPHVLVPGTGTVAALAGSGLGTYNTTDASGSAVDNMVGIRVNSTPAAPIVVTASTGVKILTSGSATTIASGSTSATIISNTVSGADTNPDVWVYATTPGTHTVTLTRGSTSTTVSFRAKVAAATAYSVALSDSTVAMSSDAYKLITATVTDVFGNAVSFAASDAPQIDVTTSGVGLLNGFNTTASLLSTGADGTATFQIYAPAGQTGTGTITATLSGGQAAITGQTAPVTERTVTATVTASTTRSIDDTYTKAVDAGTKADAATAAATTAGTKADAATAAATTAGTKADAAATEAAAATLAATAAGTKADAAKAEAALATAAATKAGTDAVAAADAAKAAATKAGTDAVAAADAAKAEAALATAAAKANAVEIAALKALIATLTELVKAGNASADAATDAALEGIDAGTAATDSANIAAENADAATAAAEEARDAADAAIAAAEAATAAAEEARDIAQEALDAANAAVDAAALAAEAADAATVAAEEAREAAEAATAAIEELATQMSTLFASMKAQLTTIGNTIAKIAKKVKA